MITEQFTYEYRYQGVHVADVDATAYVEVGPRDWWVARVTLQSVGGEHDVDLLPADFIALKTALYTGKDFHTFRGDVEEAARDFRLDQVSYDREMARA